MTNWLVPWEPSVTVVIVTLTTALLYARGSLRTRPRILRQASFWLGLGLLYAALHTHFDYYAEHVFFMHRVQHAVLHHIGPFLIVLARPGQALAAGGRHIRFPEGMIDFLNHPFTAAGLFCGLILLWLIPPVHFVAMLNWRLYRLMNWGMVVNGLMFWGLALNNFALRPANLSAAARIVLLLAVIPPQIAIGMLLFAAPHELYPIYSLCGRALPISPLADQQIGGLILWIPAAMMSVTGILVVMKREWLARA